MMIKFEMGKLKEHCYHDGVVTRLEFYAAEEKIKAYMVFSGDFPEDETERSGLTTFTFYFNDVAEGAKFDAVKDEVDGADILDFEILEREDGYNVKICLRGEAVHVVELHCETINCSLYRYKGMSYRNVYDAAYDSEWRQYVEDEQYFKGQETYELADGYTLDVRTYALERWDGDRLASCHRFSRNVLKKSGEEIHSFINVDYQVKPFTEFLEHSNGHRYFAYHRDLYGISYFDIDTGEVYDYIPEGGEHDACYPMGESFIITDIYYDRTTDLVAYGGCYWACPYGVMVGDLSEPLHFDPHLIDIHKLVDPGYEAYDDIDFVRWERDALVVKADEEQEFVIEIAKLRAMLEEVSENAEQNKKKAE